MGRGSGGERAGNACERAPPAPTADAGGLAALEVRVDGADEPTTRERRRPPERGALARAGGEDDQRLEELGTEMKPAGKLVRPKGISAMFT